MRSKKPPAVPKGPPSEWAMNQPVRFLIALNR